MAAKTELELRRCCSESLPWKTSCMVSIDRQATKLLETGQRTQNKLCKSLWNSISILLRVRPRTRKMLDSCSWTPLDKEVMDILERVQQRATKMLEGLELGRSGERLRERWNCSAWRKGGPGGSPTHTQIPDGKRVMQTKQNSEWFPGQWAQTEIQGILCLFTSATLQMTRIAGWKPPAVTCSQMSEVILILAN